MTSTPPAALRPRRELIAWRNAIFVVFTLSGLALASWVARVPGVRDSLGLDTAGVGLVILALSAGAILGLVAAPPVLNRVGARRGMVAALGLVSVGLVLVGVGSTLVPSVPLVAAGLAVLGFGNGSVDVMMNVEAAAAEREIGKTVMPLMHACFSIGTVVGAGLGAAATAAGIPIFWHFLVMAVAVAVGVILAVRWVPHQPALGDDHPLHPDAPRESLRERLAKSLRVWADWRLILIGLVMLGMAFAEGSAGDWLALAVVDGHDQSNAVGATVYGAFVVAMTLGRIAGGPLVDRIGRVASIRITAGLTVIGLLFFILGGPLWVVVIGTLFWGLGASLGFPLGMSAAADDEKNAAARVSAVAMIGYCAFLVGPPLIGFVGQQVGILAALFVVFALVVVSGLCAPALRRPAAAKPATA